MAIYTTDLRVIKILPPTLPSAFGTAVLRAPYIADASEWVEGAIGSAVALGTYGSATQMFPDVDDTPATPAVIQRIVALWAAAEIASDMRMHVNLGGPDGSSWREEAEELARQIRDGEVLVISGGVEYGAASSIASNVSGSTPVFTAGRRDASGELIGDEGSLDRMTG